MAVAAAPCEERVGRRRTGRPTLLSVLPVLLAAAAFGSQASFVRGVPIRHTIQRTIWARRTSKWSRGGPRRRGPRPRPAPLEVTPARAGALVARLDSALPAVRQVRKIGHAEPQVAAFAVEEPEQEGGERGGVAPAAGRPDSPA